MRLKNLFSTSKRFGKNKRGAAALEFAIVAPLFLTLMMSTFEVGWFYFVNSAVDGATINIAREIRTGQIRGDNNFDVDEFMDEEVCPRLQFFGNCEERLTAEVMVFSSFQELADEDSATVCQGDDPDLIDDIVVDPGGEQDIVRIRICLVYDTLNPTIGLNLATKDGQRRITSTYIHRNEPYERNVPGAG